MKYIVDENNLEETSIVVRGSKGNIREIKLKDLDEGVDDDVLFYDYDGTLLYAYKADDFLKMDRFPGNPQHDGLISRGWNWSFEGAQNYVRKYGKLNVGQMYAYDYSKLPESQRNALLMEMHIPEGGLTNVPLLFSQSVSHGVEIDWGDGSEIETVEGTGLVTTTHQYPSDNAVYTIAVKALDGCEIQYGDGENQKNIFGGTSDYKVNFAFMTYVESIVIPEGVTSIGQYAFAYCFALQSLTIPEGVTNIGQQAFYCCYALKSLAIPEGVTSIGQSAFTACYALKSLTIPEGITSIDGHAFNSCYALKSLTIPEGVTSIGERAFVNCIDLQFLTIPEGVTNIGQNAFSGCRALQSLTIPEGIISIGLQAFSSCNILQSLTIPEGVTSIGQQAFYCCYALRSLTIPEGVTSIGQQAFANCSALRSLTIPEGVTSIEKSAFASCLTLQYLAIPEGVTSIGQQAFGYAYSLQSITLPASLTTIGASAFDDCFALETVVMLGMIPPTLNSGAFELEGDKTFRIYVPYSEDHSILNAYKAATNWAAYADYIVESEPTNEVTEEPEGEPT